MSKNLIIVVLGTLVLLFVLDETCIWNFIPDKCTKGVVVDSSTISTLAEELGYDICACDNRLRYPTGTPADAYGGTTITQDNAIQYVRNFKDTYKTPKCGAFLSKKALDEIFCADPSANGIYCYFGLLKKPTAGEDTETFIVVEGTTKPFYELETSTAGLIFRSNSKTLCPDECGTVGEELTSDTASVTGVSGAH